MVPEIIINGSITETEKKFIQTLATDVFTFYSKNTTLLKEFFSFVNETLHAYYEKEKQSVNESLKYFIGLNQVQ